MTHNQLPLVISMTDFQSFLRCRKSFYLGYVLQRSSQTTNQAVEDGRTFHDIMEIIAKGTMSAPEIVAKYGADDPMLNVVGAFLREHPLRGRTLMVEEPLYTLVIDETPSTPAVYIRTTFDRVYDLDGWIVGEDYKTFEKAPSFDDDRNFQFRTYTAALQKHFGTDRVSFRVPYVRRVPPGSPRGAWDEGPDQNGDYWKVTAAGKRTKCDRWLTSECYLFNEIVMSTLEVEQMWAELQEVARDLVRCLLVEHRWYRTPLNAGPHSCSSCFVRDLCAAQMRTGTLGADDLEFMSVPRDDASRMSPNGIVNDPRILHLMRGDSTLEAAVATVYGPSGVAKLEGVPA
jgi:hypothetical protein